MARMNQSRIIGMDNLRQWRAHPHLITGMAQSPVNSSCCCSHRNQFFQFPYNLRTDIELLYLISPDASDDTCRLLPVSETVAADCKVLPVRRIQPVNFRLFHIPYASPSSLLPSILPSSDPLYTTGYSLLVNTIPGIGAVTDCSTFPASGFRISPRRPVPSLHSECLPQAGKIEKSLKNFYRASSHHFPHPLPAVRSPS